MKQTNYVLCSLLATALLAGCASGDDEMKGDSQNPSEPEGNYVPATISKVLDYLPAPGQFVNTMPVYKEGDTQADLNQKAWEAINGSKNSSMISLGSYGGYVAFQLSHTVENKPDVCDFRLLGNAFYANANPDPDAPTGGSSEPGIIYVAYDRNKNGKPDEDEWYEIAGSAYHNPEKEAFYQKAQDAKLDTKTIQGYEITYTRPQTEPNSADFVGDGSQKLAPYVNWTDNQGKSGTVSKNIFHKQAYYPEWIKENQLHFKGSRLPQNGIDESGKGSYYVLYTFRYGYADNYPNNDMHSAIDIDWAVDGRGNKVNLPGIDFIKIVSGVNQYNGWIGECSTEVAGFEDLTHSDTPIKSEDLTK